MPAKKPVRSPAPSPAIMPGIPAEPETRFPSARSAMWLYCFAIIAGAAIVIPLSNNIEVGLLNFIAVVFTNAGFTLIAVALTHVKFSTIFGPSPRFVIFVLALALGVAVWIPATWVHFQVYGILTVNIGPLTPPPPTAAAPWSVLIQTGVILPICQGLLFWAFIQKSLEGLGRGRGALLTALLYAVYSLLLAAEDGFSAVPTMLLVGLLAALAVYYSGSAWCGIAVIAGFGVARLLLEDTLFNFLAEQYSDLFSVRWLLITAITAFISLVLIRVISVIATRPPQIERAAPRGLWWVPLVISLILFMGGTYLEFGLRAANKIRLTPPSQIRTIAPVIQPTTNPQSQPVPPPQ